MYLWIMDAFGLVDILRDYCNANDIIFLPGANQPMALIDNQNNYDEGQLVLLFDADANPTFNQAGGITEISYQTYMALGRKFDSDATPTDLDEHFIQKYDARLKELTTLLASLIATTSCENELSVEGVTFRYDLNKFSTVIDFVVAELTLVQ